MSFVFGILVLGALLTVIFGRQVGALFVTGSLTIVAVVIIIFLVMISPLIWGFFTSSSASSSSRSYSSTSYGTSYAPPAPGNGYSPVTAPVSQAPAASSAGIPPPQATPTFRGPTIGIATHPVSPQFAAQFSMSPGYGVQVVSVAAGSPAEQAGLVSGDFIQAMDFDPITENHTMADYEAKRGAGQMIRLSVQHNDGSHWVHEWVKVVPR